jgi:hypothetical protein
MRGTVNQPTCHMLAPPALAIVGLGKIATNRWFSLRFLTGAARACEPARRIVIIKRACQTDVHLPRIGYFD